MRHVAASAPWHCRDGRIEYARPWVLEEPIRHAVTRIALSEYGVVDQGILARPESECWRPFGPLVRRRGFD